jgi:hypothetical protein
MMPSLFAALLASVVGWIFDDFVGGAMPLAARLIAGLVVSTAVFYYARRFLTELRDDMR